MNLLKHLKPLLTTLLVLAFMFTSCKKEVAVIKADATIINGGAVAADGCGWLIKINTGNQEYSPVSLPDGFKTDSLKVVIIYQLLTTKFHCGNVVNSSGITQIKLISITAK